MIKSLKLRNFRSIRSSELAFSESGISVVVGANGSGKSNLIKAIQFLSQIAREDLDSAVDAQRGVDAMLPKALRLPELRTVMCTLESSHQLFRPEWYPRDAPDLHIEHAISFGRDRNISAGIRHERLLFAAPLAVQFFESLSEQAHQISLGMALLPQALTHSMFEIERYADDDLAIKTSPSFTENRDGFLNWLGLPFFGNDQEMDLSSLGAILQSFNRSSSRNPESAGRLESWLSQKGTQPLPFCTEANTFRRLLSDIRHYDFQLTRLRQEQERSATTSMAFDGQGLPTVIRRLREGREGPVKWQRVAATMQAIAPHVFDATVSRLSTGKEFVRFIESRTGRPVESWESSDGTLRALAILAAIETHGDHGTVLIEEPEHGLHPWAVRVLMDHLRETVAARGIQVITTTHSQQVLDAAHPREVIVASRDADQGTVFRRVIDMIPEGQLSHGGLGRLWVQGLLGGVPTYE